MQELQERIQSEGRVLEGGFLKVDGFLNHQLDPDLTMAMGRAFKERFDAAGVGAITKVVTAETSGIAPALAVGVAYGARVVYARKKRPIVMPETVLEALAPSRTKGEMVRLIVSPEYLGPGDRVLLIDDFLATGQTIAALADLIRSAGAELVGVGCVIEKAFQAGRARLEPLGVPVACLATITAMAPGRIELAEGPSRT